MILCLDLFFEFFVIIGIWDKEIGLLMVEISTLERALIQIYMFIAGTHPRRYFATLNLCGCVQQGQMLR
jgi:hypothetical protein